MKSSLFHLRILEQHWLEDISLVEDLCSHGKIELVIGGQVISRGDEEYGISESALALLRTLESDHCSTHQVADRLIFHGCGIILMMGCPIGIDWGVKHTSGTILISEIVRYETTIERDAVHFKDMQVKVPLEDYRKEIVDFAKEAKALFSGIKKTFSDDYSRKQYESFWSEYNCLFEQYSNMG